MIYFLLIIIIILLIIPILMPFILKKPPLKNTPYDTKVNYMEEVNKFIKRETIFELHQWISADSKEVKSDGYNSGFMAQLEDNELVHKKSAVITTLVISRMSPDLKKAFGRQYNIKNEDTLYMYVARWVLFLIRRLVVDITIRLKDPSNSRLKFRDVVEVYMLELENFIYNSSDIFINAPLITKEK